MFAFHVILFVLLTAAFSWYHLIIKRTLYVQLKPEERKPLQVHKSPLGREWIHADGTALLGWDAPPFDPDYYIVTYTHPEKGEITRYVTNDPDSCKYYSRHRLSFLRPSIPTVLTTEPVEAFKSQYGREAKIDFQLRVSAYYQPVKALLNPWKKIDFWLTRLSLGSVFYALYIAINGILLMVHDHAKSSVIMPTLLVVSLVWLTGACIGGYALEQENIWRGLPRYGRRRTRPRSRNRIAYEDPPGWEFDPSPAGTSSSDYSIPGEQVFTSEGRSVGRVWGGREFHSTSGGARSGTAVYDWRGRSVGTVDGNRVRR